MVGSMVPANLVLVPTFMEIQKFMEVRWIVMEMTNRIPSIRIFRSTLHQVLTRVSQMTFLDVYLYELCEIW
jgi:hypothetical protein